MASLRIARPALVVVGISLGVNIILWVLTYKLFPKDTPAAILHYSSGVGIDFIGEGTQIYVLPAIGLGTLIGNAVLGRGLLRASQKAAWICWSIIPGLQVMLLVAFILLWQVNI